MDNASMGAERWAQVFLEYSREKLLRQFAPRLRQATVGLTAAQVWWRAHENQNSIGNLLLHLEGNVRQWLLTGLGGEPDTRHRPTEFSERRPLPAEELLTCLETTLTKADQLLAGLPPARLLAPYRIQNHEVTGLEAVYHVVEHFSNHYGQIVFISKMLTGADLGFYSYLDQKPSAECKP